MIPICINDFLTAIKEPWAWFPRVENIRAGQFFPFLPAFFHAQICLRQYVQLTSSENRGKYFPPIKGGGGGGNIQIFRLTLVPRSYNLGKRKEIMCIDQNELSSALFDAYDIKDRIRVYGIKNKPKDSEGSETTVGDCIEDVINFLESLEEKKG